MHQLSIRAVRLLPVLALWVWFGLSPIAAQDSVLAPLPEGTAVGLSVGRFFAGSGSLTSVALQVTELRHADAGLDLTLATSPYLVSEGIAALAADVGAAYNISRPGVSILPKLGGSALVAAGGGSADGVFGFHLGVGVVFQTGSGSGIRLDVVEHRYFRFLSESVLSVSLGLVSLPGRAP